jgi:pyrroloquinoline quinone biosynthesis protein E
MPIALPKDVVNAALRQLPQPEPVPDAAAYLRERELCLALDPRKRENYERYMAARRRSAQVEYLPIKLDIENVSRCNYRCIMCQVSEWPKGRRARDMTFEEFKSIIDEQYGLVEIKLQGMGEPMMGKEPFFEMIRYARDRHIWVRTVTNSSLLHINDNYRRIIDSDVNELQVSIDGADKQTFESIRPGSRFEMVTRNCKLLNDYCDSRKLLRTKMWTVVQRNNRHQLPALVDLAGQLGFKTMVFSLNLSDWGMADWKSRNDEINVEDTLNVDTALELVERGRRLGVKVTFWNITSKYRTDNPDKLCPWPFERAYVSSDMRVVPCCMIANPDSFELGEAGNGFASVWHSGGYRAFREAHLSGNLPAVCKGCYEQD